MMTKDEIRKEILKKRNSLSEKEIADRSRDIFERLVSSDDYINADNILIYASMGSEVRTDEIILDSLALGKKVFCPKCTDTRNGIMEFVRIYGLEDLKEGYYGIREPEITDDSEIFGFSLNKNQSEIDDFGATLIIMPLVAFDGELNRIGYKGGYYDRYLSKIYSKKAIADSITTCAIAFAIQKSYDLIPAQDHDIRPMHIITDQYQE